MRKDERNRVLEFRSSQKVINERTNLPNFVLDKKIS